MEVLAQPEQPDKQDQLVQQELQVLLVKPDQRGLQELPELPVKPDQRGQQEAQAL